MYIALIILQVIVLVNNFSAILCIFTTECYDLLYKSIDFLQVSCIIKP